MLLGDTFWTPRTGAANALLTPRMSTHNTTTSVVSYDGELANGHKTGHGMLTWPDGRQYVGQFSDDEFHGTALMVWPDGRQYRGQYCQGQKHGEGVLTWRDGRRYDGEWLEGKRHGTGVYTNARGRTCTGKWESDHPVSWEVVSSSSSGDSQPSARDYKSSHSGNSSCSSHHSTAVRLASTRPDNSIDDPALEQEGAVGCLSVSKPFQARLSEAHPFTARPAQVAKMSTSNAVMGPHEDGASTTFAVQRAGSDDTLWDSPAPLTVKVKQPLSLDGVGPAAWPPVQTPPKAALPMLETERHNTALASKSAFGSWLNRERSTTESQRHQRLSLPTLLPQLGQSNPWTAMRVNVPTSPKHNPLCMQEEPNDNRSCASEREDTHRWRI